MGLRTRLAHCCDVFVLKSYIIYIYIYIYYKRAALNFFFEYAGVYPITAASMAFGGAAPNAIKATGKLCTRDL